MKITFLSDDERKKALHYLKWCIAVTFVGAFLMVATPFIYFSVNRVIKSLGTPNMVYFVSDMLITGLIVPLLLSIFYIAISENVKWNLFILMTFIIFTIIMGILAYEKYFTEYIYFGMLVWAYFASYYVVYVFKFIKKYWRNTVMSITDENRELAYIKARNHVLITMVTVIATILGTLLTIQKLFCG